MRQRLVHQKTRKRKVASDDLRQKRVEIRLIDGPLAGIYFVDNVHSYLCLPNVSRETFLKHNQAGYDAKEWLYYKNTGGSSKIKKKGYDFLLVSTECDPVLPTKLNPWNCAIAAARNAWERKECLLYADPL